MISRRIAIAGGGIGGLTAALCLARTGHRVEVFEQADTISEVGAGLQLSPNCTGVLHALGLEPQLKQLACMPLATEMREWKSGHRIVRAELGQAAIDVYGSPYYHMHRADLIDALVHRVGMHHNITVHTHSAVSSVRQLDGSVEFSAGGETLDADLLVGADGIHSEVRESLFGVDYPSFTGNVAWRALVPASLIADEVAEKVTTVWWGPGKHFVHYYVRGGDLLNCVGVVTDPAWTIESWTEPGSIEKLKADFSDWHPTLRKIVDCISEAALFRWALYDRRPMSRWSKGHVTLLGDACHPTLPFMAQGAAMAIEDAAVLARVLARTDNIPEALGMYESMRRDRTARIQKASRRNSTIYHLSGISAQVRNLFAQRGGDSLMDWLYRYDPMSQ